MTRPAEDTRQALVRAATSVFAESGFEAGSVRRITEQAKANQAAINYHFGSKEGLYREVLRATLAAFKETALLDPEQLDGMEREETLHVFVRQMLQPLSKRDELSHHLRILNWEM